MHWCGIRENGGEPFTRTPRTPRLFPCCLDQVQTVPQVPLDIQSGIIQMRHVGWIGPIWNFNFSSGYSVMLVMIFIVKTWGIFRDRTTDRKGDKFISKTEGWPPLWILEPRQLKCFFYNRARGNRGKLNLPYFDEKAVVVGFTHLNSFQLHHKNKATW